MTESLSRPRTPPGNTIDSYPVIWTGDLCDIDITGYVRALELYNVGDEQRVLVLQDASPIVYRVTLIRAGLRGAPVELEAMKFLGRTVMGAAVFLYPVERAEDIDSGKAKAPGR